MYKLSLESIQAVEKIITGDKVEQNQESLAPYLKGYELIKFFNQFGFEDEYDENFPSRWFFVQKKLQECNGSETLKKVIEKALDPRRFIRTAFSLEKAVQYLNEYLQYDDLQLITVGRSYKLVDSEKLITASSAVFLQDKPNYEFIQEQIQKCDVKISSGDFDGAITNARALVEAVLVEIERLHNPQINDYDGDLIKLYGRVRKIMNMQPSNKVNNNLNQVMTGLTSIINGLSSLRNSMSDAHVRETKPSSRHARLIVNSSRTLVNFIIESYSHQFLKPKDTVLSSDEYRHSVENKCSYCNSGLVSFGEQCPACREICLSNL